MRIAALDLVEQLDRIEEEVLAPLPVAQPLEPRAAKDRAPRPKPLADPLDRGPRAEREAAEIEFASSSRAINSRKSRARIPFG